MAFELFVVRVLTELGFEVKHTGRTNDGGVDAEAVLSLEGLTSVLTKSRPSAGHTRYLGGSSANCAEPLESTSAGSS